MIKLLAQQVNCQQLVCWQIQFGDLYNMIPELVLLVIVCTSLCEKRSMMINLRGLCLQSTGNWKEMRLTRWVGLDHVIP